MELRDIKVVFKFIALLYMYYLVRVILINTLVTPYAAVTQEEHAG